MMGIQKQPIGATTRLRNTRGFTLIEIIVTLILVAVTGVVMFPVLRTNLTQSVTPATRVERQYQLVREMDRLTASYRDEILNESLNIATFLSTYPSAFLDAGSSGLVGVGQITGNAYSNQSPNILRVTLVDGDQQLVAYFSE